MQTSITQAVLTDTLCYLTNSEVSWLTRLGSTSVRQPICAGTIVESIPGKPVEGCIMGATINTLYLGFVNAGGTLLMDPGIGSVVGTALALSANTTPQVAMSIAVPPGVMEVMVWTLRQAVNIYFVHQMDKYAATGDIKKTAFWQLVPTQLFGYAVTMIPCAPLVYFGAPAAQGLLDMLVRKPLHILSVIGGTLPAIGIVMIIRMLNTGDGVLIFSTLGFFPETYSELSMLVVPISAAIAAYFYGGLEFGKAGNEK